ncbi:uncharacterized protein [Musca autumnalis]|uniref:uncharacterized protein n=1 Tax=Musca autumnalis TaxID=221902 RepID=UPI003CEC2583
MSLTRSIISSLLCICVFVAVINYVKCSSTSAPTVLDQFQDKILKRRTRALIFPPKASFGVTPALGTRVIGGIRGLLFSFEFDMYHALPDSVEGWKPTILLKKIEQETEPERRTIEVPSNKSVAIDSAHRRHSNYSTGGIYQFPNYKAEYPTNHRVYYNKKIDTDPVHWSPPKENGHIDRSSYAQSHKQQLDKKPVHKYIDFQYDKANNVYPQFRGGREIFWHPDQNYRERRHIYDQLENLGRLFQINMKSCIQRAMCEITTQMPPFGESLMHDIMRIVLTIPQTVNDEDAGEYGGRQYRNVNCAHRFSASCPYPVLPLLINGFNKF